MKPVRNPVRAWKHAALVSILCSAAFAGCGDDGANSEPGGTGGDADAGMDTGKAGNDSGHGGTSGHAGSSGSAGQDGGAGASGHAGSSGSAGQDGGAGTGGSAGQDGGAGTGGSAGQDGGAGAGGTAGADPDGGAGTSGAAGQDGGGDAATGCSTLEDCPLPSSDCVERTCVAGTCGTSNKANGTEAATQTAHDCKKNVCNGAGAVESVNDDTDTPDDSNDCTSDECNSGVASNPPKSTSTACGAGGALFCDGAGKCVGCTSPSQCTAPQCKIAKCVQGVCGTNDDVNGTSCDDANGCTKADTCQSGTCVGSNPVVCAASDSCHVAGTCAPSTGVCSNPAKTDGESCIDGDACTQSDSCSAGVCVGASPVVCTARDSCHDVGTCNSATGVCSNPQKQDGQGCNDGNACSQTDVCQGGVCTGGNPVVCTALTPCHNVGTCDPSTGQCSNPQKAEGESCSDGNACTQTDTCISGSCSGANPVVCPAPAVCKQQGTCDPSTGTCTTPDAPGGTPCLSNGVDGQCLLGVCVACGDGFVNGGENCDDNNGLGGDGCSSACQAEDGFFCMGVPSTCYSVCGDGKVVGTETCDDSQSPPQDGDCCSATCQLEPNCETEVNGSCAGADAMVAFSGTPLTTQGKGHIFPAGDVDYYSFTIPGTHPTTIRLETYFGSPTTCGTTSDNDTTLELLAPDCSTVLASDQDDGIGNCSLIDGAGSDTGARYLAPGTYYARVTHPSGGVTGYYTVLVTILSACGNSITETGETCDDADSESLDGCSSTCQVETGYVCAGTPSVCEWACGNGSLNTGETCDDHNPNSGDGCSSTCTVETGYVCAGTPSVCEWACGNGSLNTGEACDDHNPNSGDGCSSTCTVETGYVCAGTPSVCVWACGNGSLNTGEACDDHNPNSGDGCSSTCTVETGYVCAGTPSVCVVPEILCNDGIDNNGAGGIDSADPSCALPAYFPACAAGQRLVVIPATDLPKVIPNAYITGVSDTVTFTPTGTIARVAVYVDITTESANDMRIFLTPPGASEMVLATNTGKWKANFTATVLDSTCTAAVQSGTAPFTGCYYPNVTLTGLNGTNPVGAWKLRVHDWAAPPSSDSKLNAWKLIACLQ